MGDGEENDQSAKICTALSKIRIYDEMAIVQFWAPVKIGSATVLTTRGQPFGLTVHTTELWSYRVGCLDHNVFVDHHNNICIGVAGRVFHTRVTEFSKDVCLNSEYSYPQVQDAITSNIGGSFAMPVVAIDGDSCIGVLEFATTNIKDNCSYEMKEIMRALQLEGFKSSNYVASGESSSAIDGVTTSGKIQRKEVMKALGQPKAAATKACGYLKEESFTKAHKKFGIQRWPYVNPKSSIAKSVVYKAFSSHAERSKDSFSKEAYHIKRIMQEDASNCEEEGATDDTIEAFVLKLYTEG